MSTLLYLLIGALFLALFLQRRHYKPRNIYEVRIELTGGSVSLVEVRDWVVPMGRVHMVTRVLHGPVPPPSIRHWVAAALDRNEKSGEMTLNRIASKWQVVRKNGGSITPEIPVIQPRS